MATNPLGRIIYIEQYGKATVKASNKPTDGKWHSYGKFSKKNPTKAKSTGTKSITSGSLTIKYTNYVQWKNQSKGQTIKGKANQQYKNTWYSAWTVAGYLSGIGDDYAGSITGGKWKNARFCKSVQWSAEEITAGMPSSVNYFPTPSSFEVSLMDIDVEIDDETKKKTVVDIGRGQTGYLSRNRVRDNVLKLDIEWLYLNPTDASTLLKLLSNHQSGATAKNTYDWLRVRFLNPRTNEYETHTMYAGDRSISATYKGNYTSLKVSLVEK